MARAIGAFGPPSEPASPDILRRKPIGGRDIKETAISVQTVELFYGILGVVANVAVLLIVGLALSGRRRLLDDVVGASALPGALVVAVLATAGSLFFSEVAHFEPCRLCWYQRIAMYPLVVVLAVATWRRDLAVRRYVVPLAAIGALIAGYHYALEWFPALDTGACSATAPCTVVWFRALGFASLPYLAFSAFLLIIALMWIARPRGALEPDR